MVTGADFKSGASSSRDVCWNGQLRRSEFYDHAKNRRCKKENWQVHPVEAAGAFPPKQRLGQDGLSKSLKFLAKTHAESRLDFLVTLGGCLGFIKCLGNKF